MQLRNKIIEVFTVFVSSIFVYIVLLASLSSDGGIKSWLVRIIELTTNIFTLKFIEDPYFIITIVLLVGVTSVIINYFSEIFPTRLNFLILPIVSVLLVLLFGIILPFFSVDSGSMGEGLAMALYMGLAIVFQVIFSLIISFRRIFKK